jgi:hypothetical protein
VQFRVVLAVSAIVSLMLFRPALAEVAQKDEAQTDPVTVALIDATPTEGRFIFQKVRGVLAESDHIDLSSADDLLASFDSDEASPAELSEAMAKHGLDGLIIYRRTADAFVLELIGADGAPRKTVRTETPAERVSDQTVKAALATALDRLSADPPETDAQEGTSKAVSLPQPRSATIEPGADLSVGAFFGRRALSISTDDGFQLSHTTPLAGVEARVDARFGLNDARRGGFGATGYVRYAPFSSEFTGTQGSLRGSYIRAGAALRYLGKLGSAVTLYGQLGGEFTDLGIESNGTYVGSRYVSLNAGVGVVQRFPGLATLGFYIGALPTLYTRTNGATFGDGAVSVGAKGGLDFTLTVLEPVRIGLGYDLQFFNPRHSKGSGTDIIHAGSLRVGYGF